MAKATLEMHTRKTSYGLLVSTHDCNWFNLNDFPEVLVDIDGFTLTFSGLVAIYLHHNAGSQDNLQIIANELTLPTGGTRGTVGMLLTQGATLRVCVATVVVATMVPTMVPGLYVGSTVDHIIDSGDPARSYRRVEFTTDGTWLDGDV